MYSIVTIDRKINKEILDIIKFKYFIKNLPIDIVKKIYQDYIKPDLIYSRLLKILCSVESKQLNHMKLNNFIKIVLSNDIVIKYLIKNNKIFNQIYNSHIIKGNKTFKLSPDHLSSMSLSWLMYLYH
jgi:hypothetical protein